MKKYSFLLLLLFVFELGAQVIPPSRRVDWSIAGYQGIIPNPSNIVDVTSYGAVGDGVNDDYQAIVSAVNSLGGNMGVVYFPAGSYLIKSTVDLPDSIIIRGAGSDSTILLFDLSGVPSPCLSISKSQSNVFTAIYSGFNMGSNIIMVDSASMFSAGNYAELRQDNGAWDTNPATWAEHSVGQIVEITNVAGDTLFLKNPLRLTYDTSLNLEIQKIIPKYNVGVECLKITRLDSAATNRGNNILYS